MISEWERGVKKPTGTALKLLTLVQHKGIDILV
ncbi:helix-turn-helix domain-containing protein [Aggregatibacter actinomycetemcomitans]|nr:DNA-binding protein [Aggregatibacter actinomycetemcomitans]